MHYTLRRKQTLATDIQEAWDFFLDPHNLPLITPPSLGFKITTDVPSSMYPGMIIGYKVHPLLGIPVTWVTEITQIREPSFFIDEQRYGPYRMWHHQHIFEAGRDGTTMTDIIDYVVPYGLLGVGLNRLVIGRKLRQIFDYREKALQARFGTN